MEARENVGFESGQQVNNQMVSRPENTGTQGEPGNATLNKFGLFWGLLGSPGFCQGPRGFLSQGVKQVSGERRLDRNSPLGPLAPLSPTSDCILFPDATKRPEIMKTKKNYCTTP